MLFSIVLILFLVGGGVKARTHGVIPTNERYMWLYAAAILSVFLFLLSMIQLIIYKLSL
jgi:hypothetical protein